MKLQRYAIIEATQILYSPGGAYCKASDVAELEKQLAAEKYEHNDTRKCLDMIRVCLENLSVDMSDRGVLLYPDAIEEAVRRVEEQLADEKDAHLGASECLDMVKDYLELEGTDMSGVPPMFYAPEAIRETIIRKVKEAKA